MASNKLEVSEFDFDDVKANLKTFLQSQSEFQDYDFEGSGFAVLLDLLAYNTHYLGFNANMLANGGRKSDLPAYFRAEVHTSGVHKFLTHARLHELVRCLLPREQPGKPQTDFDYVPALKLYPVYMARGKVPDWMSKSAMTVDWHQDAEYTYYWYSALNTTFQQIDEYARSVVNTWVPITDTPIELGPVQLIRRRPLSLTRADMLCEGNRCDQSGIDTSATMSTAAAADRREYLRVSGIDDYIKAFPERVMTAEVKRGDVLFFDQLTYHRGLPNVSPNMTRWSVDFRFQDAHVPTLRSHPGFVLGSDKTASDAANEYGADLITTDEDWEAARPARRLSDFQKDAIARAGTDEASSIGGHRWALQHEQIDDLLGALQLERRRHRGGSAAHNEATKASRARL
mgnify:CR=1 FL=1